MTSEASENPTGYTPEEMDLPTDLVERIGQVCQLLGLPLAARSGEPGVALNRDGAWVPGTAADHVLVSWRVSDRLLDACEQADDQGPAEELYDVTEALETLVVEALVRGGLDVRRDPHTREWVARRITGPLSA